MAKSKVTTATKAKTSGRPKRNSVKEVASKVSKPKRNSKAITQRVGKTTTPVVPATTQFNPTRFNLILGGLIVLVSAVLVFSFLTKQNTPSVVNQPNIVTAKQNTNANEKYTVQDGDTLFLIAQKYYGNGYIYQKIADKNKLADPNTIEVGQVLDIPKLTQAEISQASASATPSSTPQAQESKVDPKPVSQPADPSVNQSQNNWGTKITEATYTVQVGDWLSKIAGRAYGDIYAYTKIAEANHLTDPDNIAPGTVLLIPR